MTIKLGIVMDPIESIKYYKDSSFAMLLEAQQRGWDIYYMEPGNLTMIDGQAWGDARRLQVQDQSDSWFSYGDSTTVALASLDVILMRKDPPFDMEYIYATYILQQAHDAGCLVVNRPDSLRNANEKLFTAQFPDCCAPSIVASQARPIKQFLQQHQDIIIKPLDGMGGASIFRIKLDDPNTNVIIETLTTNNSQYCMAQKYIPEISEGDKRILLINGKPVPYALARIPALGENRGNLAAGAQGKGIELSERDQWICAQVGPKLKEMGLIFVGIDIIGDYLTEINVTSPTCIRELDQQFDLNIAALLLDAIESKIKQ